MQWKIVWHHGSPLEYLVFLVKVAVRIKRAERYTCVKMHLKIITDILGVVI